MASGTAQPFQWVVFVTNLPPLCRLIEGTLGPVDTNMNSVHKEMNLYHHIYKMKLFQFAHNVLTKMNSVEDESVSMCSHQMGFRPGSIRCPVQPWA